MTGLTADAVQNARFQPTKFREGYDQDEVDDFLDTVTAILRSLEAGGPVDAGAAAELCGTARFRPTKLREGYDQQQVDDLLARLAQQFGALAGRGAGGNAADAGETSYGRSVGSPAPSLRAHAGGERVGVGTGAAAAPPAPGPRPGEYRVARRPAVGTVIGVVAAVAAAAALVWQYVL